MMIHFSHITIESTGSQNYQYLKLVTPSVKDPECLTRIPIFSIQDPGSRIQQQQKRRGKKPLLSYLSCSHKFHKIVNNFYFWTRTEKLNSIDKELKYFFLRNVS